MQNILHLKDALRDIVIDIHTKSEVLSGEAAHIEHISENVYQVMKEVNNAAQEMAASCSTQSEDANHASGNVISMGDLIKMNAAQTTQLYDISSNMRQGATDTCSSLNS